MYNDTTGNKKIVARYSCPRPNVSAFTIAGNDQMLEMVTNRIRSLVSTHERMGVSGSMFLQIENQVSLPGIRPDGREWPATNNNSALKVSAAFLPKVSTPYK